ncbi:Transglycosylase SLT domain-containing protein [Syntrophus gentianae]|uniref:Transglycosylase SLT domain-containing protein n=2 Tax=Syntrophus gentianae TaxID=43775 RepID=A0A1H7XEL3_9BACT|nr:Transglycosylase SLT domain-containing protein [Syntrophus gentianae]
MCLNSSSSKSVQNSPLPNFPLRGVLFLIFAILLCPGYGYSDIYKYVDKSGIIHLTNAPTQTNIRYDLVMKEKRIIFSVAPRDITKYDDLIQKASEKYNIDSALIKAVIKAESNFNHRAVSPVGAKGLMQLMPATAADLQVQDAFHPENNIDGGVRYLRYLLRLFKDNLTLALAAYNAGEGAVARYNYTIPPYRETQNYVQRVLHYLNHYRNGGG